MTLSARPTATLTAAIIIAATGHKDQVDKGGQPYILHPMRVCGALFGQPPEVLQVGVLHDVIEDTPITMEMLAKEGFAAVVLEAVDAISRREDEVYNDYIERLCENAIAVQVKVVDVLDNMTDERMRVLTTSEQTGMTKRYTKTLDRLREAYAKHKDEHERAVIRESLM